MTVKSLVNLYTKQASNPNMIKLWKYIENLEDNGIYIGHTKDGIWTIGDHWCEFPLAFGNSLNEAIKNLPDYKEEKPELEVGYVKIEGCDNAADFKKICKESDLQKVGKEIFEAHPGEDGYYRFTKFLWVIYPDDRPECRLHDLVSYDK